MNTTARIATVCQSRAAFGSIDENREYVVGLLDYALSVKPDLVCLPETFTTVGLESGPDVGAESVPGPTTDACAQRAREHRCYVVCPIRTLRDGLQWNSAVVIDRNGEIAGIYDKIHPVSTSEDYTVMETGIRPGPEPSPVFDLDFGRVAIQICFDAGFPETWQQIADAGARLVLWPSAYNGGFPLRAYAYLHHYYVVSSVRTPGSKIIDPMGCIRKSTDELHHMVWEDINLDYAVCHWDFNIPVAEKIERAYGDRVGIWSDRDSAHFLVEPRDPSVTVAALATEFGFEATKLYHQRHRTAYADLRKGRPAPAQAAAHADRPQHSS